MLAQIEQFVNWVRRRNPQARTWRDYRNDLNQLATSIGERSPNQITFRDIDTFILHQREKGFQANDGLSSPRILYACQGTK